MRPTASKIRQAFFNILSARVADADFLDIFAGTGLMGIEALSRGARSLVAVESDRRLARALQNALRELGYEGNVKFGDFRAVLPALPAQGFDIIFADPPYKSPFAAAVVQLVGRYELLAGGGVLAVEHARDFAFPDDMKGLARYDCRIYGQTGISFFAG